MARIPDAFIDELLARSDIVEVVGARVPLKKQGREYSARCPFHDERSPSFTVSPGKQFYHCFGCGAHGTAISFLMNFDRLEFLDAVEELARKAGMEVPRETAQRNANPQIQTLYAAMEAASKFFRRQLALSDKARAYLERRGVGEAVAEQFQVGYAPDGFSALKDALGGDAQRMQLLEKGGLLSRNDRGHSYDKFRDRVMFPIHDRRGRPIAFGGRVIDPEASPKYLNSPETPLFHKGRELYGLWQVRQAHQRIPRLVVVEGYIDGVALFQHGIDTAVATLGTATTPDHAELLFRNAPDAYFCFDGDAAGRRAAVRAMESVLPRMRDGRQAFFLFLPEGEDPDSLVRSEGSAGFDARLHEAVPLSQFFFDSLSGDVNLATLEGRSRLAERAKPLLAQIPDGAFGDLMQQRLRDVAGVGGRAAAAARPSTPAGGQARPSLVRSAIHVLLQQPSLALELAVPLPFAHSRIPGIGLLDALVLLVHARPDITTGGIIDHFADSEHADALRKLATAPLVHTTASTAVDQRLLDDEAMRSQTFHDAVARLERQTRIERIEALQARMGALEPAEKDELRALLAQRVD